MGIKEEKQSFFKNRFIVVLTAILCTALWGNMIPAIKVGAELLGIHSEDIASEILFAGICFTLSGLYTVLIPCLRENRLVLPQKESLLDTLVLGFVQTTLQYVFLYAGIPNTSGFNACIISSSGTLLIVLLSHFIYKDDKINLRKGIGCFLGFLGVLALNFGSLFEFSPMFTFKGEGLIFLSTLTFVFTTPLCKRLAKYESPEVFTGYSFLIGGIILLFLGFFKGGTLNFTLKGSLMLLYLSLAAAVAGALWNYLLEYNKVSEVTIYNFLVPIFGTLSAGIMLGEKIFEITNLIALVLICSGIYFVSEKLDLFKSKCKNEEKKTI